MPANLKFKGLYTFPNALSEIPEGALIVADNVILDRNSVMEPRRGFAQYGDTMGDGTELANQLIVYKNRILRHYDDVLEFDSDGAGDFDAFDGSYVETESGLRIKYIEANGNLYFTTADGVQKISATNASEFSTAARYIRRAGGAKALDVTGNINYTTPGFFTAESKVAYRVVWGYKDVNNNLILGSPSSRLVLTNTASNIQVAQETAVDISAFAGTVPTGLYGTYFFINSANDGVEYFVWYSDGVMSRPVDSDTLGKVGIEVDIIGLTTEAEVSAATAVVLNGISDFYASSSGTSLTIINRQFGTTTNVVDSAINPTTFTFAVIEVGEDTGGASATVDLEFAIPDSIDTTDTQFFYQIYRTAVFERGAVSSLDEVDPGDEMNLVLEDFPTTAELIARLVTVTDIAPEDFRANGTPLYTNPVTGDGIAQSNEPPPLAKDIALFKQHVFYANTSTSHRTQFSLLSVLQLVSGVSTITIDDGTTSNTYTFVGETEETDITCVADVAGSLNNTYFYINAARDVRMYYVWYSVNDTGVDPAISGRLGIRVNIATGATATAVASATTSALNSVTDFEATVLTANITVLNTNNGDTVDATDAGATGFTITVITQGDGEDAGAQEVFLSDAATPAQQIDETARSLVNIINRNSAEIVNAFYLSGPNDLPGLILLESKALGGAPFFITADSTTTGEQFNPTLPTTGNSVISDNEIKTNRLYFSKFQQPEAVPLVNYFDIGPQDKAIFRILALRESLFVLKEDGIYRVTGDTGNFIVDLFDSSTNIIAPDTAAVLNNQIYLLSTQDVSTISDTGVSVISRPIEDQIKRVRNFDFVLTSFGFSSESERSYFLFLVDNTNDDVATQCLRYNTFTNSWTRFPITKTCGVVNPFDDKIYFGAGDLAITERERKTGSRKDHADREFEVEIPNSVLSNYTVSLSSVANVEVGDALVQTQYLTISKYQRILKKLDIDVGVADTNYFSLLEIVAGDDLRIAVDALAAKLDADAGVSDSNYLALLVGGSSFSSIQSDFNIIVNKLNNDPGVFYSTYGLSSGTQEVEALITDVDVNTSQVTVQFNLPFVAGVSTIFKHIPTTVVWAPEAFGDPSMMKQVRESTVIFERNNFSFGEVAYKTDLSPDFEEIAFQGTGKGDFGLFVWSEQNWGGEGSQVPLRTLIPRDKQRCRYINCRFQHNSAREEFGIFGLSYVARPLSPRAYRSTGRVN